MKKINIKILLFVFLILTISVFFLSRKEIINRYKGEGLSNLSGAFYSYYYPYYPNYYKSYPYYPSFYKTYNIKINTNGRGQIKRPDGGVVTYWENSQISYNSGSSIKLIATPLIGSEFVGWSGACSGNKPDCTFILNSDKVVEAKFNTILNTKTTNVKTQFNIDTIFNYLSTYKRDQISAEILGLFNYIKMLDDKRRIYIVIDENGVVDTIELTLEDQKEGLYNFDFNEIDDFTTDMNMPLIISVTKYKTATFTAGNFVCRESGVLEPCSPDGASSIGEFVNTLSINNKLKKRIDNYVIDGDKEIWHYKLNTVNSALDVLTNDIISRINTGDTSGLNNILINNEIVKKVTSLEKYYLTYNDIYRKNKFYGDYLNYFMNNGVSVTKIKF